MTTLSPLHFFSGCKRKREDAETAFSEQPVQKVAKKTLEESLVTPELRPIVFQLSKAHIAKVHVVPDKTTAPIQKLWASIQQLQSRVLDEPLEFLFHCCQDLREEGYSHAANKVLSFGLRVAEQTLAASKPSKKALDNTTHLIGVLVALAEEQPREITQFLNIRDLNGSEDALRKAFKSWVLEKSEDKCKELQIHASAGLHDVEEIHLNQEPLVMAQMAITRAGRLNVPLLHLCSDIIHESQKPRNSFERHIRRMLNRLINDKTLQHRIESIKMPDAGNETAHKVVRLGLGLSPSGPITLQQVRQVALASFLTRLRQGPVGSCFATNMGIYLQDLHPELFLHDLIDLLEKGYLTRSIGHIDWRFPLVPHLASESSVDTFRVNTDGTIMKRIFDDVKNYRPLKVWEVPTLLNMCHYLDIEPAKIALQDVVKRLIEEKAAGDYTFVPISVDEIVDNLCRYWVEGSDDEKNITKRKALFSFEAQATNPLLRGWEYALASMGEPGGYRVRHLSASILMALAKRPLMDWEEVCPTLAASAAIQFDNLFRANLQFLYDPMAEHTKVASDGHSTFGGFILYDTRGKPQPEDWLRIDDEKKFQAMLTRYAECCEGMLSEGASEDLIQGFFSPLFADIKERVCSKPFLQDIIRLFTDKPISRKHPDAWRTFEYLPWKWVDGGSPTRIIRTYFQIEESLVRHYRRYHGTAYELLVHMIRRGKKASPTMQAIYKTDCEGLELGWCNHHAVNYLMGHPRLVEAWSNDTDPNEWVKKEVLKPGQQAANTIPSTRVRNQIIKECSKLVRRNEKISRLSTKLPQPRFKGPETKKLACQKKERNLRRNAFFSRAMQLPKNLTIKELRQALVEELLKVDPPTPKLTKACLGYLVDRVIIELLPKKLQQRLVASSVPFADTNWALGQHDLHFAFVVNPGTGKIELWELSLDGTFHPLFQKSWVENNPWWSLKQCDETALPKHLQRQDGQTTC